MKYSLFLLLLMISTASFAQSATTYTVAISKLKISCNTKLNNPKITLRFKMTPANAYSGTNLVYQVKKNNSTTVALGTFVSRTPNIIELNLAHDMVIGAKYTLSLLDEQNNVIGSTPFVYNLPAPCVDRIVKD